MVKMADINEYLTLLEAARLLRRDKSTVARYVRRGLLPSIRKGIQQLIPARAVSEFVPPLRGNPALRK